MTQSPRPARIMIVEDDAESAHVLEGLLRANAYQHVGSVETGQAALALAESSRPDLVIMDIVLPGDLDGIQTAERIQARFDIPVLYLTAYTDENLFERARVTAPFAYLSKPYDERDMKRAIEVALDRHTLLQRIKASEAHLAEAQQVAHFGSWQWDLTRDHVEASDELLRLAGLERGAFEPCLETFLQQVAADDRPKMLQAIETLLHGDDPGDVDVRVPISADSERVLRLRGSVRFGADGNAVELVGTALDVTLEVRARQEAEAARAELEARVAERTFELRAANAQLELEIEQRLRTEEHLWASEERYRGLMDNLPDAVLVIQDEQVAFANPAAARLFAHPTPAALLGAPPAALMHPEYLKICEQCKLATLAGQASRIPTRLKVQRSDGSSVDVEALTFAFTFEGRDSVLAVLRDLTDRRQMEREAERFRIALDSLPDTVFLIDPVLMRIVDVNETAMHSLGYSRAELLMLGPHDLKPHVNKAMLRQQYAELMAGISDTDVFQAVHRRKDGSTFPVEIQLRAFLSEGQPMLVSVVRDISERKLADLRLGEANERFQQLADNVSEAFWIRDLAENRFLYASPAFETLYGKPVSSLYRHPRSFLSVVHPDDLERVAAAYEKQRSTPTPLDIEYRVVVKNTLRWLWVRTFPIRDESGKVYRTAGIAQDVTERRIAEDQYRTLIQTSMDGFWVTDTQGRLLDCNEAACRISGYSREEFLGLSITDLEAAESAEQTAAHIRRIIEQGSDRFETRHRCKDGRIIDIDSSVYFNPGPDGGRFFVFLRDISERKKSELALRESEKRFSTVFQASPIGIAISRISDGRIIDLNQAMLNMMGYRRDEALGRTTLELRIWPEPTQRAEVLERVRIHGHLHNEELRFNRKSGPIGEGLVSMEPIELNGESHLLSLLVDITDRKQAERALRDSEGRYRSLISSLPGIAYRCAFDADWSMEIMGGEVERLTGYPASEFLQGYRSYTSVIHPDDRAFVTQVVAAGIDRREAYDLEYRLVHADGSIRLVHENGHGVFSDDNQLLWLDGFIWDVTEARQIEAALRDSEALASSILRAAPVGIGVLVERVFQVVNATMTQMTGYTREELIGQSSRLLYARQADFDHVGMEKYRQIHAQGIGSVETRWRRKDGSIIDVALSSAPIVAGDLSQGVTFTAQDITLLKRAEQERLRQEIVQREALVREVHHRIKNNLQGVIGLLRQHISDHPAMQLPIEAAITQINTISLVFGLQSRQPQEEMRLRELLLEICAAAAALAVLPKLCPVVDELHGEVWLDSNASVSIALVLNELLQNALKHGTQRDVGEIAIRLLGDGDGAIVRICNPAAGLPPDFDFAAGKGYGTGLGLVRTLLPRHGVGLNIAFDGAQVCVELALSPPVIATSGAA